MTGDLLNKYNALAQAIENVLRAPDCDPEIAMSLCDLHADLVGLICSDTSYQVTELRYSRQMTAFEAMEAIARYRLDYMRDRERAGQMSVAECVVGRSGN